MKTAGHTHQPNFEPAEADIQKCAYFLWQQEGCPAGRDLDLWLTAKELVRHHVHTAKPVNKSKHVPPPRQVTA